MVIDVFNPSVNLDDRRVNLVFLREILSPNSLSDLCLKIYFSDSYSDAEFIILNVSLYCKYCFLSALYTMFTTLQF